MTRIQPECFIEVWKDSQGIYNRRPLSMDNLILELRATATMVLPAKTIALFLIKTQTTTLEARLINRAIVRQNAKI